MNGENRMVLVNKTMMQKLGSDISWPNGITIDYDNEKLYWVDARTDILARMDLDGSKLPAPLQD